MKARDVMVTSVISVGPDLPVQAVANTLVKNNISGVPVISHDGKLLGIVSEGDLLRRVETHTERRRSWWLDMISSNRNLAAEFVKTHGLTAKDVMTSRVVTTGPDTPLHEIADLMENHGVKRIPIVENGRVVGIVSRANLIQALASGIREVEEEEAGSDESLREAVVTRLKGQPWGTALVNVIVRDAVVDLWGVADSEEEKNAIRIAAETTPGVRAVNDNLRIYRIATGP
jgi:CBS domain-containing protein